MKIIESMGRSIMLKRGIDIVGALVGLILLVPIMGFVSIGIFLTMGRPVIFRQLRPGKNGKLCMILKFRTMRSPRSDEIWFRSDEERLTSFGSFLRKFSIDELPELWNVLKGQMSLVGPRPLLKEYFPKYSRAQKMRHNVLPGITGWAQVNGRQRISFSKRLELDVWYVNNWNNWLDFRILFLTIGQAFLSKGVILGQKVIEVDDLGISPDCKLFRNSI